MKQLVCILLILLYGCSNRKQWASYTDSVNQADSISITYKDPELVIALSPEEREVFKEVATQNTKVEYIRKFLSNIQVDLYTGSQRLGYYRIKYDADGGFVNFHSDGRSFGFQMTYGLGRFLDEIWAGRTRVAQSPATAH